MANKIPDFQSIMYPLLTKLQDGKPKPLLELINVLAKHFDLTEDDLRIPVPSGQMGMFKNRVTWAVSHLKNTGLLYYPQRAIYQITEEGKKVLASGITKINLAYLKQFDTYKQWRSGFNVENEIEKPVTVLEQMQTPEEILGSTVQDLNNALGYELLDMLTTKTPRYFEYFVLKLLSTMGYGGIEESSFEVVGQSGDNGIDGIIYEDRLGIDRIYVQAKRWKDNKVQSKDIRDFIGSLSLKGTTKGVFITTSSFTDDARKTSIMNPHNRIILIDGPQLVKHAIEYNVGVQIKRVFEVKVIDNEFFEDV